MNDSTKIIKEGFAKLREGTTDLLESYIKEALSFRFEYNCDLDRIDMQIIYTDMRVLRGWRNRLTEMLSQAQRSMHKTGSFLGKIAVVVQNNHDEAMVKRASTNINKGWAVQERISDAGLVVLSERQLHAEVSDFFEYTKLVVKILTDKRHDLRDAYQEVQAIQALLALAVGTAE